MINKAYLALGTNLGDRAENLKTALKELAAITTINKVSRIYETSPHGYTDQGDFLNMVVEIETTLTPTELIISLQEIEHKIGRIREIVNGPRKIDIDIIFYGQETIDTPNLKIPHPRMQKRNFVLVPLAEINEEIVHPLINKSVKELLENLKNSEKIKLWI